MADQLLTLSPSSETFDVNHPNAANINGHNLKLNEECVRLGTYKMMSSVEDFHPVFMAKAGLFYSGPGDRVQCYSCSTAFSDWSSQCLDPVELHQQMTSLCKHLNGQDATNVAIAASDSVTTARIKDYLRQRCAQLARSPTPVYLDLIQKFSEIGGLSRGEVMGAQAEFAARTEGEMFAIGGQIPETSLSAGVIEDHEAGYHRETRTSVLEVTDAVALGEQSHYRNVSSPNIDFELCKTSVHERLRTFERWPMTAQVHPTLLAEAGFVYTGPHDRVQCVFCEGALRKWQAGNIPSEEHSRHFPSCPLVINSQQSPEFVSSIPTAADHLHDRNHNTSSPIPFATELADSACSSPATLARRDLLGIAPDRPKHPDMAVEASRIASYTTWPTGKQQTPQQLAKAGFFYAGFNDSVKCFFCDGGLRNWERDDDPWNEHARWFPRCKYVRQVKGDQFVEQVLSEQEDSVPQTATYRERSSSQSVASREAGERSRSRSSSTGRRNVSDRRSAVEMREVLARMDTPLVRAVLNMDIPHDLVQRAIDQRLRSTGDDFPNVGALLEAVFELSANHQASANITGEWSPLRRTASAGDSVAAIEAPRSLIEENRQLKEQRTCKICMDEEVCVVFVPCGHLVCCATCAPPLSRCPICRSTIRGTVRTYMS